MSRDILGNKQKIIIPNTHNTMKITPHRQTIGNIRTKRQTLRKKIINKQKQIFRKRYSKRRNASTKKLNIKGDTN